MKFIKQIEPYLDNNEIKHITSVLKSKFITDSTIHSLANVRKIKWPRY